MTANIPAGAILIGVGLITAALISIEAEFRKVWRMLLEDRTRITALEVKSVVLANAEADVGKLQQIVKYISSGLAVLEGKKS